MTPKLLSEQPMLGGDHVAIAVTRKPALESIAGLARAAVPDAVRQDDEIACRVEQLPGPEQFRAEAVAAVSLAQEVAALAARAVQDQDGVAHGSGSVALDGAQRAVVDAQLRQRFTGLEAEILQDVVAFDGRRVLGRGSGNGKQHGGKGDDRLPGPATVIHDSRISPSTARWRRYGEHSSPEASLQAAAMTAARPVRPATRTRCPGCRNAAAASPRTRRSPRRCAGASRPELLRRPDR